MRHVLLAAMLLLAMAPVSSIAGEVEWPVLETGRAGLYWTFALRTNPEPVPPGGTIASEARWSEPPAAGSVTWYFAGMSGQTLHIFVIYQEFNKAAGRVLEIERRPIYLTLDDDERSSLTLIPLYAKPSVLKLQRNADESLTIAIQPK